MGVPVLGEFEQGGAAGDERGVNVQSLGLLIATAGEVFAAALLRFGGTAAEVAEDLRMFVGRKFEAAFYGVEESVPTSRGKMRRQCVFNHAVAHGQFGNSHHDFVAEDEKGRAVGGDGFLFAP